MLACVPYALGWLAYVMVRGASHWRLTVKIEDVDRYAAGPTRDIEAALRFVEAERWGCLQVSHGAEWRWRTYDHYEG